MSDVLSDFFAAWGESDADARLKLIEGALSEGCVYNDPRSGGRLTGTEAIAEYVSNFSANAPGWMAKLENSDTVGDFVRARVAFGGAGPDGKAMKQLGTYFGEADCAGKLVLLAGFVGGEA